MSLSVAFAARLASDVGERSAPVVTASTVFLFADFAITMTSLIPMVAFETCQAVRSRQRHGQTNPHLLTPGKGDDLRDGFLTRAEPDLVWCGGPVQNVDGC